MYLSEMKVPIDEYARLCGVTRQTIYNRIESEQIKEEPVKLGDRIVFVIDTELFPPKAANKAGRKKDSDLLKGLGDPGRSDA